MAYEKEESYALHGEYLVSLRLMTLSDILIVVCAQIFSTTSLNLQVVIGQDGATTQHTSVIEGDTAPVWNEEFRVYV
jgi:hypothetical protein